MEEYPSPLSPSSSLLEDPSLCWWFAFTLLYLRAESGPWRPWRCNSGGQLSLLLFPLSFFCTSADFSHQTLQSMWWHLSVLSSRGCFSSLSPYPPPWSHSGTLRGCAVTALAHCRHRHDLILCGKQPPLMASFQCFPPVWLPVWGGVHMSGSSLLSSFSKSGSFLCLVREQRGWAPCEALRAGPVEAQRRHSALCSKMLPTHSCAMFSPDILNLCLFSLPSQSKLFQCEEALLKIQMLPLPLPDFEVLSWGLVKRMSFKMHFQHLKNKITARKFISTFLSTLWCRARLRLKEGYDA